MVFSLIGTDIEEINLRKVDDLRFNLGFNSSTEMRAFLDGPLFKPMFEEYSNMWIRPQQEKVRELGGVRKRGPQFATVEERMTIGERTGSDKFSTSFPDKSLWDQVDHCAYAMFHICKVNTKRASGLFFNKGLSPAQIHLRAWALIKHEEFNMAPSRARKGDQTKDPAHPQQDLPEGSNPVSTHLL